MISQASGMDNTRVAETVAVTALESLRSGGAARGMTEFIRKGMNSTDPVTINDLVVLSQELESRVDDYLTENLIAFLHENVPVLAEILDVERLVTERIDSFNVTEVEDLVLNITGRHLRWVNYFGAILGAIIGLVQVILLAVT